jgi:hypothetical protein
MSSPNIPSIPEIITLPNGHLVLIPVGIPEENKAEIRRLTAAETDRQALDQIAALLRENLRMADEDLIAAIFDITGMTGRVTDPLSAERENRS